MADQCCFEHDNCFHLKGRSTPAGTPLSNEQAFLLCNAEFEVCMLQWNVPPKKAAARRTVLDAFGWGSFEGSTRP